MAERGSSKHGPILDEKMQQETRGLQNAGQSPHVEDWRETEPVPDETDSPEIQEAFARGQSDTDSQADEDPLTDGPGNDLGDAAAGTEAAGEEP